MRNGVAVRHLAARAVDVDVNPLPIAGHVGESVDHRLADGDPLAGAKRLARLAGQVRDRCELVHRHSPGGSSPPSATSC